MKLGVRFATALLAALILFPLASGPAAAADSRGHVYLLRGLANIFSLGMDSLADKLNARGIPATVHEYGQWAALADQAAAQSRAAGGAPIVIIGHSLGADAAIEMGERLTALGVPARLVVTFDPVGVTQVGAASGRFVNYYQTNNGYGKRLTQGPGFRGQLVNRNLDSAGELDHFNIEKSPRLHAEVIGSIQSIMASGSRTKSKSASAASPRKKHTATAAAKPAESKSSEGKSSGAASGETKPAEAKPAEPAKPAESKPDTVAGSQSAAKPM